MMPGGHADYPGKAGMERLEIPDIT